MKKQYYILTFILFVIYSCNQLNTNSRPSAEVLEVYKHQNKFTDPGDYLFLYDDLPESYKAINALIKKQLIHPLEASEMRNILPEGRFIEDGDFLSVEEILEGLMKRDSNGLTMNRKPENRLVIACYHHGLLLTSMLRSKGIPVRMRAGFARYFEKKGKVRFGHVICEICDEEEKRWVWVDPDREFVDMKRTQFELPDKAWRNLRKDHLPNVKYVAALMSGEQAISHILLLDHLFVMADEQLYWHTPTFLYTQNFSMESISEKKLLVLDQIAKLLSEPDINVSALQKIYIENDFIHPQELSFDDFYEVIAGEPIDSLKR